MIKTVQVACEGADLLEIDEMIEFQGNLKTLDDEEYEKLKESIINLKFSFPAHIWKSEGKNFVIDAHQRIRTIRRMRDEDGFFVPPLPVVWVHAKDEREAAKKVLAATSQYGQITGDGLNGFMKRFDISMDNISTTFRFPEIDIKKFEAAYFPKVETVEFKASVGSKEYGQEEFETFDHECPKCGFGFNG